MTTKNKLLEFIDVNRESEIDDNLLDRMIRGMRSTKKLMYAEALASVCGITENEMLDCPLACYADMSCATEAQKREAILQAYGKWVEE